MWNPLRSRSAVEILWYVLGLYVVLLYIEGPIVAAVTAFAGFGGVLALLRVLVGLAVVVLVFVIPPMALRRMADTFALPVEAVPVEAGRHSFPSRATVMVGMWLLVFTVLSFVGLMATLRPPAWLGWLVGTGSGQEEVTQALVTTFAAGIGASVTSILGYLKHASELKNFDVAYTPWFFARPILGMLLGLIFYFVVRGGLLAVVPNGGDAALDVWAMAAIGALVGLFSKNAIEKLREVFNTLFRTERDWSRDLKARLPGDVWKQVAPYVAEADREEEDEG